MLLLLRKSQMAFNFGPHAYGKNQLGFDWPAPKSEPHHKAYTRTTASGTLVHVAAKGPQIEGREKLEHGMPIMYRGGDMPRRRKGTVTGSDEAGWHVTGVRQGDVATPEQRVLTREQIWTIPEHEADRAPKGTHIAVSGHGRILRPEIVNERAKKGYARLGMSEWDVLSHPEVVKTMRNQLNKLANTNTDIMDRFTIRDGMVHSDSQESMEIYSKFEDSAINSLRRQTANAPDEMLNEFRDHLQGKRDNSRIYWTMMKDGYKAALRKVEGTVEEFRDHDEFNTTAEGEYEAGMRDISAQTATPHYENSELKRRIERDATIEAALNSMRPKSAELLRRHFGLGDQKPQSVTVIAHEMGVAKEKIERALNLSIQAFAATKASRALREFLKSRREDLDLRKSLAFEEELVKSHIKQYLRQDGTAVKEHEDKRVKKHSDLVAHENKHGDQVHTGSDLNHGADLLDHLRSRGWKEKEVSAVRPKTGSKSGSIKDMPAPSTIKGKNQENQALQSAQRTIHKMHEAVKNGSDPVATLQSIGTTRGNPYLAAVDDEKKQLLAHFGHEVDENEKHQKFDKDGHTVILSGGGKKVAFAGADIDAKGEKAVGALAGKKQVESTDTGKKEPKFIVGRENKAYTAKMNEVNSHYALVEAHDLTASHSIQGHVNKAYPQEIQPRERERVSSQMQMANIMNGLKPELFGHSATAADGAPIVGKDGAVESGNGRTIALSEAYKRGLADKYKDWLKGEAGHFGLQPEDVEKMKAPMLVRLRDESDGNKDRAEFAREANQSSNLGSSPAEQAWTDADRIDDTLLKKFTVDEDGEIFNDENMPFINGFLTKLGKNETAGLLDADGEPNKKCIERIQNAVFAKVYGSSVLTEFQAESAKPRIRNVLKALNACVGDFAQVKGHDDLDVVPDMMEAIEYTLSHQNVSKTELEHTLKNAGALNFTGDTPAFKTDFAVSMVLAVADRTGSRSRLQNVFKAISNELKTEVTSRENPEVDMFAGPAKPKTKEEVVKTALDKQARQEMHKSVSNGAFLLLKAKSGSGGAPHGDIGRRKVHAQAGSADTSARSGGQNGCGRREEGQGPGGEGKSKSSNQAAGQQGSPHQGAGARQGGRRAGTWLIKSHVQIKGYTRQDGTLVTGYGQNRILLAAAPFRQTLDRFRAQIDEKRKLPAERLGREALYADHGNNLKPIGEISPQVVAKLGLADPHAYTGEGYFLDHHFNHHPNLPPIMYLTIPDVLMNPDEVVRDTRFERAEVYAFIRKYDRHHTVVIDAARVEGKLVLYKTFFAQKKKPYKGLPAVWQKSLRGREDYIPSIDPDALYKSAPGGSRFSALLLPDNRSVPQKRQMFKQDSNQPSDKGKPAPQTDLAKAHVVAYDRLTHSGALAHILAHEDSRVSGYGAKLSAVKDHRDLHELRTQRFGHLPHWGKIDDATRQHIVEAEERIHDRLKARDFHEKLKAATEQTPTDTIDSSGWKQARLFKAVPATLYLLRKSQMAFNFGGNASGKKQLGFDFSAPKHEEARTIHASTRHLTSGAVVQVKEHKRTVQVAEKPQPTGPSLKHTDEDYLYRDVGHVPGSRKELAAEQASMIKQRAKSGAGVNHREINWDALEENPREAYDLITKDAIAKEVDWEALKAAGVEPGAGFLLSKLYAAVAPKPEDSAEARKDFVFGINALQDRFEGAKTPADVIAKIREISDEMTGFTMNPEQEKEWERLEAATTAASREYRRLRKEQEVTWNAYYGPQGRLNSLKWDQEKRLNRGWKADPELQQRIDNLKVEVDSAYARNEEWLDKHKAEMDGADKATTETWKKQQAFKQNIVTQNVLSHPLTRGWNSFGKKFFNAINYSSYKGSDAFGTHVATARSGKVKDWSWLDKDAKPRSASKTSVQFQLKVAEHIERIGGAPLPQSDYGTNTLQQDFNLANVQSGNWVLKDLNAAKHHTEQCALAFQDMADMLGIPHEEISLNGRLSIAFGARGSGGVFGPGAAAHYESKYRVINLTKMKGGGSLTHEWLHAADDVMGEVESGERNGRETYATDLPGTTPVLKAFKHLAFEMENGGHNESVKQKMAITEAERDHWLKHIERSRKINFYGAATTKMVVDSPDLSTAIANLFQMKSEGKFGAAKGGKATKQYEAYKQMAVAHHAGTEGIYSVAGFKPGSKFYVEAQKIDAGGKTDYWATRREMAARAFAAYISDKLHEHGRENTYLSSYADNKYYVIEGIKPYPEGEERKRINSAFDRLFDTVKAHNTLQKALKLRDKK